MKLLTAALISFFYTAQLATAHPTGHTAEGVQHMLTAPDHLVVICSLSIAAGFAAYKLLRKNARAAKR